MADVPAAEKQKGCRFAANSPQGLAAACFFTILENACPGLGALRSGSFGADPISPWGNGGI